MNYQKIYDVICQRGKDELEERKRKKKEGLEYYEGHHIIPVCMGGYGHRKVWKHPNITPLTAKEHLLVHKILCLLYPESKELKGALWAMVSLKNYGVRNYIVSIKEYEIIRKEYINFFSGENHFNFGRVSVLKGITGENHHNFGKSYNKGVENPMYGKINGNKNPMFGILGGKHPCAKKVKQIDKNSKEVIKIWDSLAEAKVDLGVSVSDISATCRGKQKTAGGFIWEYAIQE